jgi:uncharacterized protein (TIGR03382 family)
MHCSPVCALVGAAALSVGIAPPPAGAAFLIDFEYDDSGNALGNGQIIDDEFTTDFTITSPDKGVSHLGPTIFDSTPSGPNAGGNDPDLLVGLGNILILQNTSYPANDGSFFFQPDDEPSFYPLGYGTIVIDFVNPVELQSIDLIDVDKAVYIDVKLYDGSGRVRRYDVPEYWTHDVYLKPWTNGYDTLDLTTLAPQVGEGGGVAKASQSVGFDPTDVERLKIRIWGCKGSAGIDNIVYVPAPSALSVLLVALAGIGRRRRGA